MKKIRILLYPLSMLHGLVLRIRHWMFDKKILSSQSFDMPILKVGNLNLGGTGKTPHAEYVIEAIKEDCKTALLSRGYKRKSVGFQLSGKNSTALDLGDEAYQIHRKFPDIMVAVDKNRVHGIQHLAEEGAEVVILDDALQHRALEGGLSLMLMDFSRPVYQDYLWPAGTLRDLRSRCKLMDVIIVSKCPKDLTKAEQLRITKDLMPKVKQEVFFTSYAYLQPQHVFLDETLEMGEKKMDNLLLFSGIADNSQLIEYVDRYAKHVKIKKYADHHAYSEEDVFLLIKLFDSFASGENILLTTEKDAVRLMDMNLPSEFKLLPIYYLPIRVHFLDRKDEFNSLINNYVRKNKRNR